MKCYGRDTFCGEGTPCHASQRATVHREVTFSCTPQQLKMLPHLEFFFLKICSFMSRCEISCRKKWTWLCKTAFRVIHFLSSVWLCQTDHSWASEGSAFCSECPAWGREQRAGDERTNIAYFSSSVWKLGITVRLVGSLEQPGTGTQCSLGHHGQVSKGRIFSTIPGLSWGWEWWLPLTWLGRCWLSGGLGPHPNGTQGF